MRPIASGEVYAGEAAFAIDAEAARDIIEAIEYQIEDLEYRTRVPGVEFEPADIDAIRDRIARGRAIIAAFGRSAQDLSAQVRKQSWQR